DQIVLWIIDKTDERYPVGLHPTAEVQRSHIDFHLGARERLRQMVEKRTPLCFLRFWTVITVSMLKPFSLRRCLRGIRVLHKTTAPFGAGKENFDGNK